MVMMYFRECPSGVCLKGVEHAWRFGEIRWIVYSVLGNVVAYFRLGVQQPVACLAG